MSARAGLTPVLAVLGAGQAFLPTCECVRQSPRGSGNAEGMGWRKRRGTCPGLPGTLLLLELKVLHPRTPQLPCKPGWMSHGPLSFLFSSYPTFPIHRGRAPEAQESSWLAQELISSLGGSQWESELCGQLAQAGTCPPPPCSARAPSLLGGARSHGLPPSRISGAAVGGQGPTVLDLCHALCPRSCWLKRRPTHQRPSSRWWRTWRCTSPA